MMRKSNPSIGAASLKSKAFTWGMPSMTSTSTMSASRWDTIHWAAEWPTSPAPTIVTFSRLRLILRPLGGLSHLLDDGCGKLARPDFARSVHEAGEVVGHD